MSAIEDLGRVLGAQISSIDEVVLHLIAAEGSILDVAEILISLDVAIGLAEVSAAQRSIRSAIASEVRGRQSLNAYLKSLGLPSIEPPAEVRQYIERRSPGVGTHESNHDVTQPTFVESFAWILPDPITNDERRNSSIEQEAVRYCQFLADLASALMVVSNVTSGSVSLAIQKVAASIRKPLVATGVEAANAVVKASNGGNIPSEVAGQLTSERILGMIPGTMAPGSNELKITAFTLRSTGILMCLAANRRLRRCPCFPDFLSDMGVGFIDLQL
jgi:hypothetical protein